MPNKKLEGEFIINKKKGGELEAALQEGIVKNKAAFYTSLCVYPENVTFANQDVGEIVVLLVRRALITNVPWILSALFLIFIPPLISLTSNFFIPFINLSQINILAIVLFYYLAVFGFILVEFTLWYFNVGLVTNKRIVDFDLSGILFRHVSETRLELIEDVSYTKIGAVRSFFNYGDVLMQTAGTLSNFEFLRAPQPEKIVRIIANMIGGKKE